MSEKLELAIGLCYRSRAGHKYICYDVDDSSTEFLCMRIEDKVHGHYKRDGRTLEVDDSLADLVEEVSPTAPLFIDPKSEVAGDTDYDFMWKRVEDLHVGIEIQKFSGKTSLVDVKAPDMPASIRNKLDRNNIRKLWRARIGRGGVWRYAFGVDQVVALAMATGGGVKLD